MDPTRHLRIIVVGAGLGGLSAGIACALASHNVTILESAKELAEVGAGLQLTPNSTRILAEWGIDNKKLNAAVPTKLTVHRYSGMVLAREERFDEHIVEKYQAPFLDVHRVDLQKALVAKAKELGIEVRLGEELTHLETLSDGKIAANTKQSIDNRQATYEADLVVGADGLWSTTREHLLQEERQGKNHVINPLPTGDLAYRIVLRVDEIKDEELQRFVTEPECRFWIGPNAHVVAYSLRGGEELNIVLLVPDDLDAEVRRQPGNVEEMRALFDGWDPVLTRFLDYVNKVDKWKLMHLSPLETWTNDSMNLILIGDAVHPMLPYLAQGANSSIEDGAVLGGLLGHLSSKFEPHQAIELFIKLRKARGEAIARETFKQREAFHMPDGPQQKARDELFLSCLGREIDTEFPSRWTCPRVQPWLYGYDAAAEVSKAMLEV